jgi:hypothetical protein
VAPLSGRDRNCGLFSLAREPPKVLDGDRPEALAGAKAHGLFQVWRALDRQGLARGQLGERKLLARRFALLRVLAAWPTRDFAKERLLHELWGFKLIGTSRHSQ